LKEIYAEADETRLMKWRAKMPDALKMERDEIDENDWVQSEVAIEALIIS
jgi:hypothetical protein